MGLSLGFKASPCSCEPTPKEAPSPVPDARKFSITLTYSAGSYTTAVIVYDGCTNYEGKKIMVFKARCEGSGGLPIQ